MIDMTITDTIVVIGMNVAAIVMTDMTGIEIMSKYKQ